MAKIKSLIDYFKPTNLGTLATCNKLYKTAKYYFRQAQETNKPADWTKAKDEYEKFLKHNEADVDAYIEIGVAYYNLKRTKKSLENLRQAEKFKASTALLNYYLAKIYSEKKDWSFLIFS